MTRSATGPARRASPWLALPDGSDARVVSRQVAAAHDRFLATGQIATGEAGAVRSVVAESWARCLEQGVDPETASAPLALTAESLEAARRAHPLHRLMPVIRRLLVEDAADAGLLVAVSDAAGRLLWVEGDAGLRTQAEGMHFAPGADWGEAHAGTNAPGTALALDHAVQIFAAEHLSRPVTAWSCAAAPVHDPDTGALLGALDLTGGDVVASPTTLSLVRTAAAAVEAELRLQRLGAPEPTRSVRRATSSTTLEVLGRHAGVLTTSGRRRRMSLRHAEILLLLATRADGMSADQLAEALHEREPAPVTVRAEVSRLRTTLGTVRLGSRPYRLLDRVTTDAARVRALVDSGRPHAALDAYRGPVLPESESPEVARLRDDLHARLRSLLLAEGDADALLRFADTDHSRLDLELWQAGLLALPAGSPRRAHVTAHVATLDDLLR